MVDADQITFLFGSPPVSATLDALLPHRFSPKDLLLAGGTASENAEAWVSKGSSDELRLVLEERNNRVDSIRERWRGNNAGRGPTKRLKSDIFEVAAMKAFAAANASYAPYSLCPSGVAIVTESGEIYSGGYIESAAYNPSLSPLQACLVEAVCNGMRSWKAVTHVFLAERPDGLVSQEGVIESALERIAPQARMVIIPLSVDDVNLQD